jgi:hypothetical protein
MRLKTLLFALPIVALAAMPASGQDVVYAPGTGESYEAITDEQPDDDISRVAERMSDPVVQHGVGSAVEYASESIMRLPIGRFADAIERARPGTVDRRLPRDATVGDLAGRDADYLPQELGERSREMVGMMGGFAQAMAAMMPEFERMSREMEGAFRRAKRVGY